MTADHPHWHITNTDREVVVTVPQEVTRLSAEEALRLGYLLVAAARRVDLGVGRVRGPK